MATIEEKAKRYDEAIKRAKAMIKVAEKQEEVYDATITIFPELKESEDERIIKAIKSAVHQLTDIYLQEKYGLKQSDCIVWLEKQGEQKPAGKVEPKFNEGEWLVSPNGVYWHIDAIRDGRYQVSSDSGECADWPLDTNIYHGFTIQDAKDGDVLACNAEILLFKSYSVGLISLYCWYNGQTNTLHGKGVVETLLSTRNKIYPATKEQRDTLMKAMTDAGLEFDFEKKELKKIEQKSADKVDQHSLPVSDNSSLPTFDESIYHPCTEEVHEKKSSWSEEDESLCRQIESILSVCRIKRLLSFDLYKKMLDLLKSIKERVQPKQEWSKEDKKMIGNIRTIIEKYAFSQSAVDVNGDLCEKEYIDADYWLKSLKDRVQPQPKQEWSKEDKELMKWSINNLTELKDRFGEEYGKVGDCINWLKSLRPQSTWKPTEEQMIILGNVIDAHVMEHEHNQENAHIYMVLKDLKKQLIVL